MSGRGWQVVTVLALAGWAAGAGAAAKESAKTNGSRTVRHAPAPAWVIAPPAGSRAPTPPGAPLRVVYADQQIRVTAAGQEEYQASRLKLLTPEGLTVGNIALGWSPANEEILVHRLAILREGKIIDLLATQTFAVIQREDNLEQSMLHGYLTATLQAAGLQVGDEVEIAMTKVRRRTRAGEQPDAFFQLPIAGVRGTYRLRVIEPANQALAIRTSPDLPPPVTRTLGGETERQYVLTDPSSAILPDGAPPRYSIARLVQLTGYRDWPAVSRTFGAPFDEAGVLTAGSGVKAEAARVASESPDPARRAETALRLVQDRVRYVYVGLDGGNYRPASTEETWRRRFGDCKAKTVLLIALLRELGIAAEPVLVSSKGGDGIDERLPTPAVFDHVVVRAAVNGAPVWLDGTRAGDRALALLDPPPSRWGLPLRAGGAALERIVPLPPRRPSRIQAVEIDASAGFDKPGRYRIQETLRGDEIFGIRAQLAGVASADADRMLASYWRKLFAEVEPMRTSWRFDEANRLLVLGMEGEGKVEWEGDADEGRTHYLFGGGFPPPPELKRPKDQPQDASWANDYPSFTCYATTVKVPAPGKGHRWSFSSGPMDRTLGGIAYWRISSFDNGVARMVKSRRVDRPEIDAREAAAVNAAIAGFDNNKSYVFETKAAGTPLVRVDVTSRFGSFEDFAGANPPCQSEVPDLKARSAAR